jgi:polysaccharide export outer membrane protein
MKQYSIVNRVAVVFLSVFLFSCASRKDLVYYQDTDGVGTLKKSNGYEITIQPDDLLSIIVTAEDAEIAAPFNLRTVSIATPGRQDLARGQETMQLYLVDDEGTIDFPVLGKLKMSGLSRTAVTKMFQEKIGVFIKNPIINFRITNFKVSVQGEVNNPGIYAVNSERVTLIEALTMAKDLTIYGKRNNILIIREINGLKSYNRVDITKSNFMNSPFYYLAQNDVVYVEPNKNRINASAVGANTGVFISITSIAIGLISLIINITK